MEPEELWTDAELEIALVAYLGQKASVEAGGQHQPTAFHRRLSAEALPGRTEGSVARRMSNISWVLASSGLPYFERYSPSLKQAGTGVKTRILNLYGRVIEDDPLRAELNRPGWSAARARIMITTRATVAQSGKQAKRMLKNKQLRCKDLKSALDQLFRQQGGRCAQTGIPFDESNVQLRASLDRIDSDGHYQDGSIKDEQNNLQLVTHWYNIAKGTSSDHAMREMLRLHARSL